MIEYGTRDSNSTPLQARPFVALFYFILFYTLGCEVEVGWQFFEIEEWV
jgi:hypothetical protein